MKDQSENNRSCAVEKASWMLGLYIFSFEPSELGKVIAENITDLRKYPEFVRKAGE